MNLFKLFAVLGLLLSANLMAGGPLEEEGKCLPRVLRGVKVTGQSYVDITSEDGSNAFPRTVDGQFGMLSPSMNWSTYLFQTPYGVFWTEEQTSVSQKLALLAGTPLDFNPKKDGFALPEDQLKKISVKFGATKISLWDALLKYQIDANGILVITQ